MEVKMSAIFEAYIESTPLEERCPARWHAFLYDHGLKHISLSRIVVSDKNKWLLTKIKYGIE
jgi:hypothetical protein